MNSQNLRLDNTIRQETTDEKSYGLKWFYFREMKSSIHNFTSFA